MNNLQKFLLLMTGILLGFAGSRIWYGSNCMDHVSITVSDFEQSLKFYDITLKELGYQRLMTFNLADKKVAGYGHWGKPSFWLNCPKKINHSISKEHNMHIAFAGKSKAAIQKWHKACLDFGASNNGFPGPRPEYHKGYYAGFIIDPDGVRIEAVIHHNLL